MDGAPGPQAFHGLEGVVLAAGAGRRMGTPKSLLQLPSGVGYLETACRALLGAGCARVTVVLGAGASQAADLLERAGLTGTSAGPGADEVEVVVNSEWSSGMATSLRAGLSRLQESSSASAAVVHLVDLPGVGPDAVRRVIQHSQGLHHDPGQRAADPAALVRASYDGVPGHPVVIGRDHWSGVVERADGDAGARGYFREHPPHLVEVGDLATGRDVDTPSDRHRFEAE